MAEVPITVVMPVHNAERYVRQAVASILAQTWTDFELLVVNDGSTDRTRALLAEIRDPRTCVVDTDNRGVGAALRLGVERARGEYVARMDADDESLPERLARLKTYLDEHPDVVMVHSLADAIDATGRVIRERIGNPRSDAVTRWLLLWQNVPIHPTVMMRASALRAAGLNYRPEMSRAEDFDLWNRLALLGRFGVLPEVLLRYRVHRESVTRSDAVDVQHRVFARVIADNFARYGVPIPVAVAEELAVISGGTWVDPIRHRYGQLVGRLHRLQGSLGQRFCARLRLDDRQLAGVQAEQLVRWSRYMLNTSRPYAVRLLGMAVRRHARVCRGYLFWAVLVTMLKPGKVGPRAGGDILGRSALPGRGA